MLAKRLTKIRADKAIVPLLPGRAVALKEPKVMTVTVAGIPEDAVVIAMEAIGRFSGIKNGPWTKASDYLVVFHDGAQDGALFVELKKTLIEGATDGREQLRRSLPILRYLETMCAIDVNAMANGRPALVRYALIGNRGSGRLDKQRVRARDAPRVDRYKDIRVVSVIGQRIAFASLAAH